MFLLLIVAIVVFIHLGASGKLLAQTRFKDAGLSTGVALLWTAATYVTQQIVFWGSVSLPEWLGIATLCLWLVLTILAITFNVRLAFKKHSGHKN